MEAFDNNSEQPLELEVVRVWMFHDNKRRFFDKFSAHSADAASRWRYTTFWFKQRRERIFNAIFDGAAHYGLELNFEKNHMFVIQRYHSLKFTEAEPCFFGNTHSNA